MADELLAIRRLKIVDNNRGASPTDSGPKLRLSPRIIQILNFGRQVLSFCRFGLHHGVALQPRATTTAVALLLLLFAMIV